MLLYAASSLQAAIQHNGLCVRVRVNPRAWKPLCCVWQRDLATLTPAHGHCHTGMLLDTCDHCLFTENVLTSSLDASVQTSTVRATRIDWIHQFLIWFLVFLFFFVRGRNYSVKVKKILFRILNNKEKRVGALPFFFEYCYESTCETHANKSCHQSQLVTEL